MSKKKPAPSAVDHPPHYNAHPSGVEAIAICEAFNFNVGNAVKYLWRAGLKGDALEDLEKARWYVTRELERLRRAPAASACGMSPPLPTWWNDHRPDRCTCFSCVMARYATWRPVPSRHRARA